MNTDFTAGTRGALLPNVPLLSQVFRRVPDSVEPFSFRLNKSRASLPLFDGSADGLRKQPDLFGKLDQGQANEIQEAHKAVLITFFRQRRTVCRE